MRRIIAAMLAFVLALSLSVSIAGVAGVFAFDRDLYLEADQSPHAGLYYSVKRDRALGPDRILFRSTTAQEAWQVFITFKQMEAPPKLFNFVQPAPKDGGP